MLSECWSKSISGKTQITLYILDAHTRCLTTFSADSDLLSDKRKSQGLLVELIYSVCEYLICVFLYFIHHLYVMDC